MSEKTKYLIACQFAIMQLTSKGSCSVLLDCNSDNPTIVEWKDVLDWIEKEYEVDHE